MSLLDLLTTKEEKQEQAVRKVRLELEKVSEIAVQAYAKGVLESEARTQAELSRLKEHLGELELLMPVLNDLKAKVEALSVNGELEREVLQKINSHPELNK